MTNMSFQIDLNATRLASPKIAITGVAGSLDTKAIQILQLEPGSYSVQTHSTSDTSWQFDVTAQGVIEYMPTLDLSQGGFLTGRGSTTLGVAGFPITLDDTKLSTPTYFLNGITHSLDSTQTHLLNLLPGRYQFFQGNNEAVPEADFEVGMDGQVHFLSSSDAILKWRDADRTLEIDGIPTTLDGTMLATRTYFLNGITNSLDSTKLQPLRLLPGRYQFFHGNGAVPEADFEVQMDGKAHFPASSDAILKWRDLDHTLEIVGFPITVDGTTLATRTYFLNGITNSLDSTKLHPLNLLPGHYQFFQANGAVPEADFDVLMDGTVDFPPSSDAILKRRDAGRTLEIVGFAIALDGTALTAATFLVYGITNELTTSTVHRLQLLPGKYYLRNAASFGPLVPFEIRADGTVAYDPSFDADTSSTGFLRGMGTSTIFLLGHKIYVDARLLTTRRLHIYAIRDNWETLQVQEMHLLPGPYNFRNPPSGRPLIPFEIKAAGTVEYDPSFDADASPKGFFKGRGTSTITLLGHTIFLDARALTTRTLHIYGILDNWPTAEVQKVSLLPGQYYFRNPPSGRPLIPFEIKPDGAVAYDPSADADANTTGYFKGLGTSRIELLGHSITVDASALRPHIANFYISSLPDALPTSVAHRLQLLPASYIFSTTAGTGPDIDFDVAADGVITYARERDISASPPGFLSGQWSNLLGVVGIGIQFDATAYVGAEVVLQPFGTVLDTSRPQNISLLPVANLRIEIRTAELKVAYFDLSAVGRIVLDDPYPFVELRWQGRQQVLRLTTDEVRQKGPCCLTLAVEDG